MLYCCVLRISHNKRVHFYKDVKVIYKEGNEISKNDNGSISRISGAKTAVF